jgi:hypothetical protein
MRQDAHEQLKMQGRKGPLKVIYPSSYVLSCSKDEGTS